MLGLVTATRTQAPPTNRRASVFQARLGAYEGMAISSSSPLRTQSHTIATVFASHLRRFVKSCSAPRPCAGRLFVRPSFHSGHNVLAALLFIMPNIAHAHPY